MKQMWYSSCVCVGVRVCVSESEREWFYNLISNYLLIIHGDAWPGATSHHRNRHLWSTLSFSSWHTSFLEHPVLLTACVCVFSQSVLLACSPQRSLCEIEAGVAYIRTSQMNCKWISHRDEAERSWIKLCLRGWSLLSFQHDFSRWKRWNYITPMCGCVWEPHCFTIAVFCILVFY